MRAVFLLLLAAITALAWACSPPVDPNAPNIVVVTIDTLRCDHCSCYGYPRETTPRMDALAREGVKCEVAYAPMPTTGNP